MGTIMLGGQVDGLGHNQALPVEHDREVQVDDPRVELQPHRELEANVVVAVEDDPLGLDLVQGERPRRHGGNEDLVDDLERHAVGADVEGGPSIDHDAEVRQRIVATHVQGGQGQQQRIGREGISWRGARQRDRLRQAGAGEFALDAESLAHEPRYVGGGKLLPAGLDHDAHGGGGVLGHDRRGGFYRGGEPEQRELELADLADGSLGPHGRGREGAESDWDENKEGADEGGSSRSSAQSCHR